MSYSYTADDLVGLAKLHAWGGSQEAGYPASSTDWYTLVSSVYRNRVYPRMLKRGDNWAYVVRTATLTSGAATYALSGTSFISGGDFHRLKRLQIDWSSDYSEPVPPLEERLRPRMANVSWGQDAAKAYVITGRVLELVPTPTSAEQVTIVYVPQATALTHGTATIYGPELLDECVALEVAIRVRSLQNERTADLRETLAEVYREFDENVGALQQDDAPRIVDVYPEGRLDPDLELWEPPA